MINYITVCVSGTMIDTFVFFLPFVQNIFSLPRKKGSSVKRVVLLKDRFQKDLKFLLFQAESFFY